MRVGFRASPVKRASPLGLDATCACDPYAKPPRERTRDVGRAPEPRIAPPAGMAASWMQAGRAMRARASGRKIRRAQAMCGRSPVQGSVGEGAVGALPRSGACAVWRRPSQEDRKRRASFGADAARVAPTWRIQDAETKGRCERRSPPKTPETKGRFAPPPPKRRGGSPGFEGRCAPSFRGRFQSVGGRFAPVSGLQSLKSRVGGASPTFCHVSVYSRATPHSHSASRDRRRKPRSTSVRRQRRAVSG